MRPKNCLDIFFVFAKSLQLMLLIPTDVDSLRFSNRLAIPVKGAEILSINGHARCDTKGTDASSSVKLETKKVVKYYKALLGIGLPVPL